MGKEYLLKIIIVGDAAVGKTSLVLKYVKRIFETKYLPTLGVDIYSKILEWGNLKVNLTIWDIAGQKGWEVMQKSYFRGSDAAIAVFDLTRSNTLENLKKWLKKVYEYTRHDLPIVIIGNKNDLKLSIEVNEEQLKSFDYYNPEMYFTSSAKTGENVKEAFEKVVNKILERDKN